MYIYYALINALSAHMIHINLNMIFYTHVEHSPTKTIYIKYYLKLKLKSHYKHINNDRKKESLKLSKLNGTQLHDSKDSKLAMTFSNLLAQHCNRQ